MDRAHRHKHARRTLGSKKFFKVHRGFQRGSFPIRTSINLGCGDCCLEGKKLYEKRCTKYQICNQVIKISLLKEYRVGA